MDLLLSFSEFEQFKEMMLFARAHFVATTPKMKSGKAAALGLSNTASNASRTEETLMQASDLRHFEGCIDGLQVAGTATKVHKDECMEGDERPDLDMFAIGGKGFK
jgi:hypothetical protein